MPQVQYVRRDGDGGRGELCSCNKLLQSSLRSLEIVHKLILKCEVL